MSRIDDELKLALRREEPSHDFADRVMSRIAASSAETKQERLREKPAWRQKLSEFFQPVKMKWVMATGLATLLVFVAAYRYREHQRALIEMAEGERAKEQVMMAMKIASAKLNVAQRKVQESGEK